MEWISVKDKLPKIGSRVLVHFIKPYYKLNPFKSWYGSRVEECKYDAYESSTDIRFGVRNGVVDHWMPLPDPPK